MTNTLSILLGLLIVGGICLDFYIYDSDNLLFLGKKFADLVEWMAFWR
jgi:hypothetical protein